MSRKNPVILVVEDMKSELSRYLLFFKDLGYQASGVSTLEDALKMVKSQRYDLVLTDIHLSSDHTRSEGLELIRTLREEHPYITLMAMSFDPEFAVAETAKQFGAWMFLRKPISSADELAIHVRRALDVAALQKSTIKSASSPAMNVLLKKYPEGIVMNDYLRRAVRGSVGNEDTCTVIIGETGTGKEEIAKLIHRYRSEQEALPFVAINCANLQGELLMSTLFGHKKGAFTGAVENTQGAIGQANGGILFLDEFHRLSIQAQERLLRVLQDGSYQKLGESTASYSRFQLVAATSLDLEQAAMDGTILMDLRMRLYGMEIKIPPLRERGGELADFVDWYFARLEKPYTLTQVEHDKLIDRCREFYWQGNIRQLFGVLQVLVINASLDNEPIRADRLPVYRTMLSPGAASTSLADVSGIHPLMSEALQALMEFAKQPGDLEKLINQVEKAAIVVGTDKAGSIKDACITMNQARSTLDAKRRKHGLA